MPHLTTSPRGLLRALIWVLVRGLRQGAPASAIAESWQDGNDLLPKDALLCAPAQINLATSNDILMALYTYNFGDYRHEIARYHSWDDFHGQDSRGTQAGELPSTVGLLRMWYISVVQCHGEFEVSETVQSIVQRISVAFVHRLGPSVRFRRQKYHAEDGS